MLPKVALVGAGPGDPGLLTLRGRELLERAEVVIYDHLASPELLNYAPPEAERIDVGRRSSEHPGIPEMCEKWEVAGNAFRGTAGVDDEPRNLQIPDCRL
jgi:uroporphyrinogen III methyltransferase/synthase